MRAAGTAGAAQLIAALLFGLVDVPVVLVAGHPYFWYVASCSPSTGCMGKQIDRDKSPEIDII